MTDLPPLAKEPPQDMTTIRAKAFREASQAFVSAYNDHEFCSCGGYPWTGKVNRGHAVVHGLGAILKLEQEALKSLPNMDRV